MAPDNSDLRVYFDESRNLTGFFKTSVSQGGVEGFLRHQNPPQSPFAKGEDWSPFAKEESW